MKFNAINNTTVRLRALAEFTVIRNLYQQIVAQGYTHVELYDHQTGKFVTVLSWDGHNGALDAMYEDVTIDEDTLVFSKPGRGHSAISLYITYGSPSLVEAGFSGVPIEEQEWTTALVDATMDRYRNGELPHLVWSELSKPVYVPEPEKRFFWVDAQITMIKTYCVKGTNLDDAWEEGREELQAQMNSADPLDGWEILPGSHYVNDVFEMQEVGE